MKKYSEIFARHCGKTEKKFYQYVTSMQENGTWGTDVELLAFATLIQTPISTFLNNRWISYLPRFTIDSNNIIKSFFLFFFIYF